MAAHRDDRPNMFLSFSALMMLILGAPAFALAQSPARVGILVQEMERASHRRLRALARDSNSSVIRSGRIFSLKLVTSKATVPRCSRRRRASGAQRHRHFYYRDQRDTRGDGGHPGNSDRIHSSGRPHCRRLVKSTGEREKI